MGGFRGESDDSVRMDGFRGESDNLMTVDRFRGESRKFVRELQFWGIVVRETIPWELSDSVGNPVIM